jgi:hypothetical protein
MTLTVNGTVIARSGGVGLEDNASEATINGNGTIYLKGTGSLFGTVQSNRNVDRQKLILDGVTLVGVDDNDQPLVDVRNGGELVLKSGAITGNSVSGWEWGGGGVAVGAGAVFTMTDGGNATKRGNACQVTISSRYSILYAV